MVKDSDILYMDDALLICQKAPGIPSQSTSDGRPDLLSSLMKNDPGVRLVHRLDTPTGGVMVFARTQTAAAGLSKLVQDHDSFQKTYLAILSTPPVEADTWKDLLYHDKRTNKAYVVDSSRKGAKEAILTYKVLCTRQDGHTLVQVCLHTGRTHQIRVQFASRGFPLVGDGKYGSREKAPYTALWASQLLFAHPLTGKDVSFQSLPDTTIYPWSLFAEQLQSN